MKKLLVLLIVIVAGYFGYQHFMSPGTPRLEALYEMPYVVVYGQTHCGWTQKCLKELKKEGIDVIFENIDQQEVQQELFPRIDRAGYPRNGIVIPVIDVNAHILVGYDREKVLELYHRPSEGEV
jgi:hypothetical protein